MGPCCGSHPLHTLDSEDRLAPTSEPSITRGIGALVSNSTSIILHTAVRSAAAVLRPVPVTPTAEVSATTASISIALGILRAVNSASEIFPPLKGVTTLALFIIEFAEKVHADKEDWCELSQHISVYLAVIMKHMEEDTQKVPDDWSANLSALQSTLGHIQAEINSLQRETCFQRVWHRFSDPKQIETLQKEFDKAIELCQFRAAMMTAAARLQFLSEGNQTRMVEALLRKFKDDIGAQIDRMACFSRLPDPQSSSWNQRYACLTGTRGAHRMEVSSWISAYPKRPCAGVFLVADALGSGKSALAHSVCQQAQDNCFLVASFFFSRLRPEESTSRHLFGAIIRGLCRTSPQVRDAVAARFKADETLAIAPPTRQFKEVILPVRHLLPQGSALIVVIDGIDEGCRSDDELLEVLRDSVPLLPSNLCFIVTSRPDPWIMPWFDNSPHVQRLSISLIHGGSTDEDLARYIQKRLKSPRLRLPFSPRLISLFVNRCEGVFLWADTILTYIEDSVQPEEDLQSVLSSTTGSQLHPDAEAKMDSLYDEILSRLKWTNEPLVRAYRAFMGVVVTSYEPVSLNTIIALHGRQDSIKPGAFAEIAKRLRSLLDGFHPEARDQPIRLIHLSAKEFLTQRTQASKPYHLDVDDCHRTLATLCLTLIERDLKPGALPLGYLSGTWDIFHFPRIPKFHPNAVSGQLSYACRFFAEHAIQAKGSGLDFGERLCRVLEKRCRAILEMTAALGQTVDLGKLHPWLKAAFPSIDQRLHSDVPLSLTIAKSVYDIGTCLRKAGRHQEALIAIQHATSIYRLLVSSDPCPRLLGDLARCLNSEGACLGDFRRYEAALSSFLESEKIFARLAREDEDEWGPDLGRTLNNLSLRIGSQGQVKEALEKAEEAYQLFTRLTERHMGRYEPHLGWSLTNLANRYADLKRQGEALKSIQRAVDIFRRLAQDDHPAFDEMLSFSLHLLSILLDRAGRRPSECLDPLQDAVDGYHRLIDEEEAFEPELASSLDTLSTLYRHMKRFEDALGAIEEAVSIYRKLASIEPEVYEPQMADSLDTLSVCHDALGQWEPALSAATEAVKVYRRVVATNPRFRFDLAFVLRNQSVSFERLQRTDESLDCLEESVSVYREILHSDPGRCTLNLAQALQALATTYIQLERLQEGLAVHVEAIGVFREALLVNPSVGVEEQLAAGLRRLGKTYSLTGSPDDAVAVSIESIAILRRITAQQQEGTTSPETHSMLAMSLSSYSDLLQEMESPNWEKVLEARREAIEIYRRLSQDDPASYSTVFNDELESLEQDLRHEVEFRSGFQPPVWRHD